MPQRVATTTATEEKSLPVLHKSKTIQTRPAGLATIYKGRQRLVESGEYTVLQLELRLVTHRETSHVVTWKCIGKEHGL